MKKKPNLKRTRTFLCVATHIVFILVFGWYARREAIFYCNNIEKDFNKTFAAETIENDVHMSVYGQYNKYNLFSEWTQKLNAELINFLSTMISKIRKFRSVSHLIYIYEEISSKGINLYYNTKIDLDKIHNIFPEKNIIVKIGSYLYYDTYVWKLQNIANKYVELLNENLNEKNGSTVFTILGYEDKIFFISNDSSNPNISDKVNLVEIDINIPNFNSSYATTYIRIKLLSAF